MSEFQFPVIGMPHDPADIDKTRRPFWSAPDGRLYRPQLMVGIRSLADAAWPDVPFRYYRVQLDCGSDVCVFAEEWARQVGVTRDAGALVETFRTAAGTLTAWFADIQLRIGGLPGDHDHFDWTAMVGFVPTAKLPRAFPFGILGIAGGLERFLRTEFVLSPVGLEMPVVRVFTPGLA